MEFMGFHIVDIVIVALVAFLAIKGLVNGFSKELLNFITIVAGVVLAARYNTTVVELINEQKLLPQIPDEFAKMVGFILIIVAIWLIIGVISSIISKLTASPSGFISRILGYILSAARYVFIFSLIIFGVSQSEFFKEPTAKFQTETQLFEPMTKLGAQILNIDTNQTVQVKDTNSVDNTEKNEKAELKTNDVNLTDNNTTLNPEATETAAAGTENNASN